MVATCRQFQIPATAEISRSGNGAHLWIFFSSAMPAVEARQLGIELHLYENDRLMKEFGEDCALSEAFSHIDHHFMRVVEADC